MSTRNSKILSLGRRMRAMLGDTRGNTFVEFALGAPFLVLLLLGAINLGLVIEQNIRVASAARAGAQYGAHTLARSFDSIGMETAARNDANDSENAFTVTTSRFCKCPETEEPVVCASVCTGLESPRNYVSVTVERQLAFLLPIPGFEDDLTVAHTVDMRVR